MIYHEDSNAPFYVMAFISGAILAALFTYLGATRPFKDPPKPCSEYAESRLAEIPAKCITPQGGFKLDGEVAE